MMQKVALFGAKIGREDYSSRLFYVEENNNLPYNDVWEYLLESKGILGGQEALESLKQYEAEVQSLRK